VLSIQTNGAALAVQRNLSKSSTAVQTAAAALSSGLRVRTGKDDAAGLGIATRMSSALVTNRALARGVNDGISLVQTAEGALGGISDILQRCTELAAQAANGSLSDSDRMFANAEAQELLSEVNHIATATTVFGKSPLHAPEVVPAQAPVLTSRGSTPSLQSLVGPNGSDGAGGNRLWMQSPAARVVGYVPAGLKNVEIGMNSAFGDVDLHLFAADGTHIAGTPLSDPTWTARGITTSGAIDASLLTTAKGFDAGASYNGSPLIQANPGPSTAYNNALSPPGAQGSFRGMTIGYTGDGDRFADDTNPSAGATDGYHGVEAIKIDDVKEPVD
jgi:flagellin